MLDPLTALGLASNIVQLITFTGSIISKSNEIANSAQGGTVENLELEAITANLQTLSSQIITPRPHHDEGGRESASVRQATTQLRELCEGCSEISQELLEVIRQIGGRKRSKNWSSFRQALLSVWKEKKIEALSKRLERYRRQIDTALLVSLRAYMEQRHSTYDSLIAEIQKGTFSSILGDIKQVQLEMVNILNARHWQLQSSEDISLFTSKVAESANYGREARAAAEIYEMLRFTQMETRFSQIPEAYQRTFEWILEDCQIHSDTVPNSASRYAGITEAATQQAPSPPPETTRKPGRKWNSFVQWLRSEETLYWITGKPGSGKSTLMKYLRAHLEIGTHLEHWSGHSQVTVAGFFFWNSGASMQMSELGMFQTLLHQAIEHNKHLIPKLFPRRWSQYAIFGKDLRPWSIEELSQAFETLISDKSSKFFFFIDGLDEFEGNDGKLANLILDIATSKPNVKMCVASRPWLVFEDAFHHRPSLLLEDLTAPDIRKFVSGSLGDNRMYAKLQRMRPDDATWLVLEVTERACGVFLWVHLVVLSLLEGLRDGNSIADLRAITLLLPSDIEELFAKIIGCLTPSYMRQACEIFQCLRTTPEPMSLLDVSLMQEGFHQAIIAPVKTMEPDELDFRAETTRRRLNSRCRGLLEAPDFDEDGPHAKVQYLHRTVKDFLATRHDWEMAALSEQEFFHPNLALSGAFLFRLKTMSREQGTFIDDFWAYFAGCLEQFDDFKQNVVPVRDRRAESYLKDHLNLIKELQRTGDELFDGISPNGGRWLSILVDRGRDISLFTSFRITHWYQSGPFEETAFPKYAMEYKVVSYLRFMMDTGKTLDLGGGGPSLLSNAIARLDVSMVKLLLEYGVSPNDHHGKTTIWYSLLSQVDNPPAADFEEKWACIVELFLRKKADLEITIQNKSLESIINARCREADAARIKRLLVALRSASRSKKSAWTFLRPKLFFGKPKQLA